MAFRLSCGPRSNTHEGTWLESASLGVFSPYRGNDKSCMNYIRGRGRGLAQGATDLGVCATAGDSWSLRSWSDSFLPPGHLPGSSGKVAAPKQIIPRLKQGSYGLPVLPPRSRSTSSSSGWTGDPATPKVRDPTRTQ